MRAGSYRASRRASWSVGPWSMPDRVPIRPSDGSTSVDVARSSLVILQGYTTPTVITQFTGGHSGREITLIGNANVTIQNNATIKTSTGANKVLAANLAYRFVHYNGVWYELG